MKLVVGLGNPGKKYEANRHNTGFIVLDSFVQEPWKFEEKFNSEISKKDDVIFAKPLTFMNNSGEAVSKLVNFYKVDLDNLLVIHDDMDLKFEETRHQKGRGSAGHNGVESIINALGADEFWRLRIGVGRPVNSDMNSEAWVLSPFSPQELEKVQNITVPIS